MANANSDTFTGAGWIPVGTDPNVITRIRQSSVVENFFNPVPMSTRTKDIPRSGGVTLARVGKGDAFGRQTHANDSITMRVDKLGGIVEIDEEDIEDSLADIIDTKTLEAADSYARIMDNSGIAVTAAKATHGWLYDSLYYTLTQADTLTNYTANSNITKTGTGGVTYDNLSSTLGKLEQSDWFDPGSLVIAGHPFFAQALRGIKDTNGRPIFVESSGGGAGGAVGNANMTGMSLFGFPFQWSMGLRTSAAGTSAPTGNPLLVMGNRRFLNRGDRSELEVGYQASTEGTGFDNDVNKLRFRARKGVAYGAPGAASILEVG
jgi:HK97 family phage major capsid protein